jgi:soluble lytic murein transglycosylase-like protein
MAATVLVYGWIISTDNYYDEIYYSLDSHTKYLQGNELADTTNLPPEDSNTQNTQYENGDVTGNKDNNSDKSIVSSYHRIISSTSKKYSIDQSLVYAMIKVESNWNKKAVSQKGAAGLMQLMPLTAKAMEVKNPHNPEENIEGGIKYLRYLLDQFNGDISLALAAYNAGPSRVRRYNGIPPIRETQQYVERVLAIYSNENPDYKAPSPQI